MSDRRTIPTRLRLRIFVRSLSIQASWNHERMQNVGLLATMLPWLRAQPRDVTQDRLFVRRYYGFFNTNPYLANFVVGGLVRLEDDRAAGVDMPAGVMAMFRDSLGRAFAGIGDQLFWLGFRPVVVMAICLLGLFGQIVAIIGLVAVFAIGQLALRWLSLDTGYRLGFDLVELLHDKRWHRLIAGAERTGMFLTGVTVGVYFAMVNKSGLPVSHGLLWIGIVAGVGLPVVFRRRFPGEVLILVTLALAGLVSFAISLSGS